MRTTRVVRVRVDRVIAEGRPGSPTARPDVSRAANAIPLALGAPALNGTYGPLTGWIVTHVPEAGSTSLKPSQCSPVPPR